MQMQFSVHSPNGGLKEVSRIRERVVRAEQLGFEGAYLGSGQLSTPEPFQVLACCAVAMSRIKLGTAVTNMVYQDPTVLAGSAATLSEISDGRAVLGLGTGELADAGVKSVLLTPARAVYDETVEALAREVMPEFRG